MKKLEGEKMADAVVEDMRSMTDVDYSKIEERIIQSMPELGMAYKFNTGSALSSDQMDFYKAAATAMQGPPNRVCSDKASEFYDDRIAKIGVRFNDVERHGDVQEYDVEAGWIKVRIRHGRSWKQERGRYLTQRLNGKVEPFWKR